MLKIRVCCRTLSILSTLLMAVVASAAPTINSISVRGLQSGGTTPLVIDGNELGPNTSLLMAIPGVTMQVKPASTPQHVEAEVTVDPQTPPGIYLLRVVSATGVSNPIGIGIDALPQLPFAPELGSLPVALTSELTGSGVLATSFEAKKGQRIVAEVESRRLGGKLKPVVHLLDARRTQIAWGKPMPSIGGDTRCEAVLPADGRYTIELHDQLYRGEGPGTVRLKIGDLQYADLVYPLGAERGKPATLEFLSTSLAPGTSAAAETSSEGERPAPWPSGITTLTGSRPKIAVTAHPEAVEQPVEGKQQELPAAPVAVSGRLLGRGENDVYRLLVTPGQALRFEVYAERIGSPLDATLTVMNEQSGGLASNDDHGGTKDPGVDFTVPADAKVLLVSVRDMRGIGHPSNAYRLEVTPLGAPDFSLALTEDTRLVSQGGNAPLRIHANRAGYSGPIKLALIGLPNGVAASNAEIPAGVSDALVNLTASGGPTAAIVAITGESTDPQPAIRRDALLPESTILKIQPWLRRELAIGVTPPTPFTVAWDLPSGDGSLVAGKPAPLHVKVDRAAGTTGAVQLSIVSSQTPPQKRILENGQPKAVDDLDRTLRFEGASILAADQSELAANLFLPFDLAAAPYDLTVRADLLAADNKTVVASAFAPVRRLQVSQPTAEQPLAIFEDQPEFIANLTQGGGQIALHEAEKYSGKASVRVTPDQKFNLTLPGFSAKIRQNPGPGEYRYLRFAWKKPAGNVAIQLAHDGLLGQIEGKGPSFRYQAGPGAEFGGATVRVDAVQPPNFTVVTRDLFADFGEFNFTGLSLAAIDGDAALFDHIYLGRSAADFELVKP